MFKCPIANVVSICIPNFCFFLLNQDADLIEILWKHDIDLGVPRDLFLNISSDVQKENVVELKKKVESLFISP